MHNGQDYLADALRSVASQSVRDLEIIVVDDGSTDSTFAVARSFDDARVRCVRQDRAGAAAARNRGVGLAEGSLIAFLDADDLWMEDKLQLQIACLRRGDGEMIFVNVEEFISPDCLQELEGKVKTHPGPRPGVPSTLLIRRKDFQRVGLLDTRWRIGEFVEWHARAIDLGLRPVVLPEVLGRRRLHIANSGRRERAHRSQYAGVVKSILDRRRALG